MILSLCPNPSIDTYAWLDHFEQGGVNRISRMDEFPGGKGVHVALAIAELGAPSELMGAWAGNTGDWIQGACEKKGVSSFGPALSGNNRKCYTFRSEDPFFCNSELLEPGPVMSAEDWQEFKSLFNDSLSEYELICMSGSFPKNAPVDAYRQLIDIANEKKTRTFLDTTGPQLEEAIESGFFGLHLNEEETIKFCGSNRIEDLVKKLQGKVEMVALTKGKEGLDLYFNGRIVSAKVEIQDVKSTVGSGDCLTAGIAFATNNNLELEEIAAYGVACGAANCLTEDLGMLKRADVEKLLPRVQIKTQLYEH